MVVRDAVQQAFYNDSEIGAITFDDAMALVGEDAPTEAIAERLAGSDLLPDYASRLAKDLLGHYGLTSEGAALAHERYESALAARCPEPENTLRTLEATRALMQTAFSLFELLQNPGEHPITSETIDAYAVKRSKGRTRGTVDLTVSYAVPPCDYLQFLADGCEVLSARPLYCDCHVEPHGSAPDPLTGWVGNADGADLVFSMAGVVDDDAGYSEFLTYLLKFLLDVHLYDLQVVTHHIGEQVRIAKHAIAGLWVGLCDGLADGRAGICRVCGKPFIATNERKEKTRYCETNGKCAKAFARTRKVLALVAAGATPEDAVREVGGISLKRVRDITARNAYVLSQEFGSLDLNEIAHPKGGDAME